MSASNEPISPMHRVFAVLGAFAAGCAASVLLWSWWSDRCGDNCPTPLIVHMLVYLALLPTASTMVAVLLVSIKGPRRVKWRLAALALLAAACVGALVARLP